MKISNLDPQNFLYLAIDLFAILIPLIFSFENKLKFYRFFPALIPAISFIAGVFLIWDWIFTENKIWGFNSKYLTGISFYGLPIEEILFFFCIPYACIFTYLVVNYFFEDFIKGLSKSENIFFYIFLSVSALSSIVFSKLAYTQTTFLILTLILVIYKFFFKERFFMNFLFSYLFILFPFSIINGILTGTGIKGEVVWYNNSENLGIRILTIPIEDVFYGFALIFMNLLVLKIFLSAENRRFEA